MKKIKSDLIKKLKSALTISIVAIQFSVVGTTFAAQVSVNGSPGLEINGGVNYNYTSAPKEVDFQITEPFVCTSITDSNNSTIVDIRDGNNVSVFGINGLMSTVYDLQANVIKFATDDSVQCASAYGLHQELLYSNGFEAVSNDVEIRMLNSNDQDFPNNMPVADMQVIDYYYVVKNNGQATVIVDVLEYFLTDQSAPYFINMSGNEWNCTVVGSGTTSCGDNTAGDDFLTLTNAVIEPGDELEISLIRETEVPNGTLGDNFDLLAAVFNKTSMDVLPLNNVAHRQFGSVSNTPATITFSGMPAFAEDGMSSDVAFTVSDPNLNDELIQVTAVSSNPSIIPNNPANIIITDNGGGDRSIRLIPAANANTEVNSVSITITADDGINPSTQTFSVMITPINDKPSFEFTCIENIVDSQTGVVSCGNSNSKLAIASFISSVDYGNSFDDIAQSTDEYLITSISDPNSIIHSDFSGPSLSIDDANNELLVGFTNNYGTATVGVRLKDNGGTITGGVDLSDEKQFTITVPVPTYTFTATVSGLPAGEFVSLGLESTGAASQSSSVLNDGTVVVGSLELNSDYAISINTQTPAAGCSIDNADVNDEIVGTNLAGNVNFTVTCGVP